MFRRYKMYAYLRRPRLLNLKEVYCENRFLPSQKDNGRDRNTLKSSLGRPFLVDSLAAEGRDQIAARQNFHTEVDTKQTLI